MVPVVSASDRDVGHGKGGAGTRRGQDLDASGARTGQGRVLAASGDNIGGVRVSQPAPSRASLSPATCLRDAPNAFHGHRARVRRHRGRQHGKIPENTGKKERKAPEEDSCVPRVAA